MTTTFDQIAIKIIKEQELIVGPIAWQEAKKVPGLKVDQDNSRIEFEDPNNKSVLDNLVGQYVHLFGRASREVCKDAVANLIADLAPDDIPTSLK
jgi:hypothetical protein